MNFFDTVYLRTELERPLKRLYDNRWRKIGEVFEYFC